MIPPSLCVALCACIVSIHAAAVQRLLTKPLQDNLREWSAVAQRRAWVLSGSPT